MELPDPVPLVQLDIGTAGGVSLLLSSWESPGYLNEEL